MWTKREMSDQSGKTVLVTGANTGIGYEVALAFYEAGAHVIVAGRDVQKVNDAMERIKTVGGTGSLEAGIVNLASLADIQRFADSLVEKHQQLHVQINNAGVMMPPAGQTEDGFEYQFGVNVIGHFALTGRLYPLLKQTRGARVVTVSSGAHKLVDAIDYENLKREKPYDPNREYAVSKLANLLVALELQRRLQRVGNACLSTAAHPGVTRTDLQRHIPDETLQVALSAYKVVMQPWQGALPILYAATAPEVKGGDYYGPDGENELDGYPAPAQITEAAQNETAARQLWVYAEQATGLHFPF
ncbi:SDR family NAD(P)-dependent oxidoreductase [Larkinella harenae]